ncbi:MAG: hypothetical protein QXJ17_06855 [Nitrososphaeria archaeon]
MFHHTQPQSNVRQLLRSDVNRSLSSISQIESQLNWLSASIAYIDSMATSLPSRFKALRANGFVHRVGVERQLNELVDKWNATRSSVSAEVEAFSQQLRSEVNALKSEGDRLLNRINQPFLIEFALRADVMGYTSKVNNFSSKAQTQIDNAKRGFSELRNNIEKIGKVVVEGEEAVNAAQSASVAMMEKEHPILCVKAKKQSPGEKNEGRIIVTDQRILYEVEKQVVLEKKLFIATKTKVDRVLDLEIPLGVVAEANKGRVGLIAWEGVYIELKQGQKFKEVVFDTSGDETEKLVEVINYVLSGQADKDKSLVVAEEKVIEGPKAFFCLKCGAPLDLATTRGIAEIECKYCGTRNKIQ